MFYSTVICLPLVCSNLKHVFFVSNTSSDLKYIPSLFYAAVIKCWANSRVLNAETAALRRVKKLYSPRVLKSFMLRAVLKGFISTLLQPHNEAAASPYIQHTLKITTSWNVKNKNKPPCLFVSIRCKNHSLFFSFLRVKKRFTFKRAYPSFCSFGKEWRERFPLLQRARRAMNCDSLFCFVLI